MAADTVTETVMEHRGRLTEAAQARTVYLTLLPREGEQQTDLLHAIRLMVSSSTRQVVIEHAAPQPLGITPAVVLDLELLGWNVKTFAALLEQYPYSEQSFPLILRADWLLVQLADGTGSPAYRRLLLGTREEGADFTTLAQVLEFFSIGTDPLLTFGHVEGASGVNKAGVRQLESRPLPRGYCWITSDVKALRAAVDPLEQLGKPPAADGQELIIGIPKVSTHSGVRGAAQVYFLSDGAGNLVDRAPVDLVEDSTRFRGFAEIRAPGGCISCHKEGLQMPTMNDYGTAQAAGMLFFAEANTRSRIDAYYGGDVRGDVELANEQYARYVNAVVSLTPAEASGAFVRAIAAYDAKLDLTAAAVELGSDPGDLRRALTTAGVGLSTRAKGLAHGLTITRPAFEEQYLELAAAIAALPPGKEEPAENEPPDSEPAGDSLQPSTE